jgi:hypothetical protein
MALAARHRTSYIVRSSFSFLSSRLLDQEKITQLIKLRTLGVLSIVKTLNYPHSKQADHFVNITYIYEKDFVEAYEIIIIAYN